MLHVCEFGMTFLVAVVDVLKNLNISCPHGSSRLPLTSPSPSFFPLLGVISCALLLPGNLTNDDVSLPRSRSRSPPGEDRRCQSPLGSASTVGLVHHVLVNRKFVVTEKLVGKR